MKSILEEVIRSSGLGLLPSIALVIMFTTMLAIIFWTYRSNDKEKYKKFAALTLEKGDSHE